jgi:hypothetical protein
VGQSLDEKKQKTFSYAKFAKIPHLPVAHQIPAQKFYQHIG